MASGCPLTRAELEVMTLLGQGLTYQQIALARGRAVSTIRSQVHSANERLGLVGAGFHQAVLVCAREGWINMPGYPDVGEPWLAHLEQLVGRLADVVALHGVEKLTPRQRSYLVAFDEHLRARGPGERDATRVRMNRQLAMMLDEAGVRPPVQRRRDLVDLIADWVTSGRL